MRPQWVVIGVLSVPCSRARVHRLVLGRYTTVPNLINANIVAAQNERPSSFQVTIAQAENSNEIEENKVLRRPAYARACPGSRLILVPSAGP